MIGARFTAWLSETEREALEVRARQERTSLNVIMRLALRAYLGMDDDINEDTELPVTSDTQSRGIPT